MTEDSKSSKPKEVHHVVICETLPNIDANSSDESLVMIGDDIKRKESIHSRHPSISIIRKDSLASVMSLWFSFRGIAFTAMAALFFSLNASIVKHLVGVNPSLLALMRYAGTFLLSTPSLRGSKMYTIFGPPESRKWILFRAITGATAMYLRYVTVRLLPLANAIVITLSVPVFACVFARLFLKEPCGIFHSIALAITLVGIGFTAKLDVIFGSQVNSSEETKSINVATQLAGLACGLASALSNSLTIISLRKLKNVHQSVIMWNTGWIAAIEMSIITYFLDGFHIPDSPTIPWLLMTVGIFSYYGQMMFTKALQLEEASIVAMLESSCDLVLAFVFQIFFFKVIPDTWTVIGALLVTTAVLLTSFRKFLPTLPHDSSLRRWFSFLIE
ncbi:solute carrier family 35 member G1-like [Brevipalpus obovatus]|uniref:solute carrier family 35 member G1-like n=1 Tax=Brevipalpus obovatus TaxID=246614 RepID=UPI003D9E8E46